jgi:hypothetical protein
VTSLVTNLRVFGIVLTLGCLALGAYVVNWRQTLRVIAEADLKLTARGRLPVCDVLPGRRALAAAGCPRQGSARQADV